LNVVTTKRHYRYYGITASYLPSPRYYREIFPIPAVITVVTALLPLSPLPCHPVVSILSPNLMIMFVRFRTFLHVETQQFVFSCQSNHRQWPSCDSSFIQSPISVNPCRSS